MIDLPIRRGYEGPNRVSTSQFLRMRPLWLNYDGSEKLTNFQVKCILTSSDIPFEKLRADKQDLLFVDNNNELIPYWIEKADSTEIIVWLKFSKIIPGKEVFWLYYGNANFSGASDGEACILPNTLIYTSDGIKQIRDVKEGDLVLTHKGRWKKVLKVLRRHFAGRLIKITPYHLPPVSFTPEHPIYAIKVSKCPSHFGVSKGKERICRIESCRYRGEDFCQRLFEKYEPRWYFADELEKGDYVLLSFPTDVKDVKNIKISDFLDDIILEHGYVYPVGRNQYGAIFKMGKGVPNNIPINAEFLRLVGYYLAEGFAIENGIEFAFGSHEEEYIKDVCKIIKQIFGLIPVVKDGITNAKRIIVYSAILKRFFSSLFGSRAAKKQIPEFMMKLPREKQFALLQGLLRGDGCFYNRKQQKITYSSISVNLAYQIFLLLARQGILATFKQIRDKGEYNIQGRKGAHEKSYGIEIFNDFAEVFGSERRKQKKFEPKYGLIDRERGYIILPIRKIEYESYDGYVYNLEVEDDNSYNTLSMSIHNCFEFFDDFEEISLDPNKWEIVTLNSPVDYDIYIQDGKLVIDLIDPGTNHGIVFVVAKNLSIADCVVELDYENVNIDTGLREGMAVEVREHYPATQTSPRQETIISTWTGFTWDKWALLDTLKDGSLGASSSDIVDEDPTAPALGDVGKITVKIFGNSGAAIITGVGDADATITLSGTLTITDAGTIALYAHGDDNARTTWKADNIRVRKYTEPEPSVSV